MLDVFIFERKSTKKDKIFNFLKDRFSVMDAPVNMIFGVLSETYVRLTKIITSRLFSRYNKSYTNLNVKRYLKLNGLSRKDEPCRG